jgi:hypothetical protein
MKEELLREIIFVGLAAIFCFVFFYNTGNDAIYWGFLAFSGIFYFVAHRQEREPHIREYMKLTAGHFLLSGAFFTLAYVLAKQIEQHFILVALTIAILLFSMGFVRLLFARFN